MYDGDSGGSMSNESISDIMMVTLADGTAVSSEMLARSIVTASSPD